MKRWATLYQRGDRAVEASIEVTRGLWDGFWLGVLTEDQLGHVDERHYDADGLYQGERWNRSGLRPWEAEMVSRHVPPQSRVVVIGAGGGREVLALLAGGYRAEGYEPNAGLARAGGDLTAGDGYGRRVVPMGRTSWPAPASSADVVLFGWGSYMLVPSRARRIQFLREAARTTDGGAVLVSFFLLPPSRLQFRTAHRVSRVLRRMRRAEVTQLGDALVPNYAHHFDRRQVQAEFEAAGMHLVEARNAEHGYGWAVGRTAGREEAGHDR